MQSGNGAKLKPSDSQIAGAEAGSGIAEEGLMQNVQSGDAYGELQYRLEFENLILRLATHFIHLGMADLDQGIQHTLDEIGTFAAVDRCYLFQYRGSRQLMDNTHEWCAPGIEPHKHRLQGIGVNPESRFIQLIESNSIVHVPHVGDLAPEEFIEKGEWQVEGIQSLICVPLIVDGQVAGFMGFDSVRSRKHWSADSIALLKIVGSMVGNACARKRAETIKQNLEAQIQHGQKLESLGVLAGGIAHDFNNLLMGLVSTAELLLMKLPEDSEHYPMIKRMYRASKEATELTRQLLSYSGKGTVDVRVVDLSELVDEMKPLLSTAVQKNSSLGFSLAQSATTVRADPTQLRQILLNLVTNASEAIVGQRGSIDVRTGTVFASKQYLSSAYLDDDLPEGNYCFLEVEDNGKGIDAGAAERIFDPFFSTKFTGRGLGLAVVLGIVRRHRGAIKVYSRPGIKTSFTVLFPYVAGRSEVDEDVASRPKLEAPNSKGLVLLVDDEELTREAAGDILESFGYTVELAESGAQALAMVKKLEGKLALIIVDMTMPGMSGSDLFERLQTHGCTVPVILSSGYSEEDAAQILVDLPFAGFLQKPYGPGVMQAVIEKALAKK